MIVSCRRWSADIPIGSKVNAREPFSFCLLAPCQNSLHNCDTDTVAAVPMASSEANDQAPAKRYSRPRLRTLPINSCTEPLGSHYHIWWVVLIKKAYRLCTGGQEALVNSCRTKLVRIKPCLDAWETALTHWLYEDWSKTLSKGQLEAIYSVLYEVAFKAFRLNVCPIEGQTCEAAVRATVRAFRPVPIPIKTVTFLLNAAVCNTTSCI